MEDHERDEILKKLKITGISLFCLAVLYQQITPLIFVDYKGMNERQIKELVKAEDSPYNIKCGIGLVKDPYYSFCKVKDLKSIEGEKLEDLDIRILRLTGVSEFPDKYNCPAEMATAGMTALIDYYIEKECYKN